ncbi:hypothetical protein [Kytococcus sedentarius]|uniref:hypothetical protein n=1 Tax=Kytococcus sedentarius TaxID=1276 RepID=UPI0035BC427F
MTDPTQLPNFPSGDDAGSTGAAGPTLRDQVMTLLQTDGMQPKVDNEGDIGFDVQGQTMFVRVTEGDVDIMRVFGQWQIGSDVPQDVVRWLNNTNDVTLGANIVKMGIVGSTLVVSAEHIMLKGESPSPRMQLSVNMIMQAVQVWHENVTKDEVQHATAAAIGNPGPASPGRAGAPGQQGGAGQQDQAQGGQQGGRSGASSFSLNLGDDQDQQGGRA